MTWVPVVERRANLAYPALKKIYLLVVRNSKLKKHQNHIKYMHSTDNNLRTSSMGHGNQKIPKEQGTKDKKQVS